MKNFIAYVEIPAADFMRAVELYKNVFSLELQIVEGENEKMACFADGSGAISFAPGYKPSKDGVIVSLNAGDQLDRTIAKVKEMGGNILVPKTKIEAEGRGFFAIFIDSEGNKLGLYGN